MLMAASEMITASSTQPGVPLHHFAHQLVGVEASFHQRLGFALRDELDRPGCGGVTVRHVDELETRNVELELLGDRFDLRPRADENRSDQPSLGGVDGAR